MLLEKGVDEIIVGENYISYLLAFNLINKGKKVLIIDDDRVEIGEQFINRMSELDKAFAMEWGNNLGIGPFMEIDKYVRRDRYILHIDSHQLLLGQDFYQNWLELIRKFPLFF